MFHNMTTLWAFDFRANWSLASRRAQNSTFKTQPMIMRLHHGGAVATGHTPTPSHSRTTFRAGGGGGAGSGGGGGGLPRKGGLGLGGGRGATKKEGGGGQASSPHKYGIT